MSHRNGHYSKGGRRDRNRPWRPQIGEKSRQTLEDLDENSLTIQTFKGFASELDSKHDRFERLVKLSRDVTIESKRVIFLLHTLDRESKREAILEEAQSRLNSLSSNVFKNIALELHGQDPYLYMRAFSPGLQEFVEAVTFLSYLRDKKLPHWNEVQELLTYPDSNGKVLVAPTEYFLGVGDLTGELMRCCIQSLGTGSTKSCYEACGFVREVYVGFIGMSNVGHKEFGRKSVVLRQSLSKMEMACYTLAVRGNEMPKHMLADVFSSEFHEDNGDEGFSAD